MPPISTGPRHTQGCCVQVSCWGPKPLTRDLPSMNYTQYGDGQNKTLEGDGNRTRNNATRPPELTEGPGRTIAESNTRPHCLAQAVFGGEQGCLGRKARGARSKYTVRSPLDCYTIVPGLHSSRLPQHKVHGAQAQHVYRPEWVRSNLQVETIKLHTTTRQNSVVKNTQQTHQKLCLPPDTLAPSQQLCSGVQAVAPSTERFSFVVAVEKPVCRWKTARGGTGPVSVSHAFQPINDVRVTVDHALFHAGGVSERTASIAAR